MVKHYVYRINDPMTGEFYFGVRTCEGSPCDDSYMGSYRAWVPEDEPRLEKVIVRDDFVSREEANQYERDLLIIYIGDELNRNYHIPSVGYHTQGITLGPMPEEQKRKIGEKLKYNTNSLGFIHSQETRRKMSEARKGVPKSKEHKKKFSGERSANAKLNWKKVNEIRRLYATGDYTQKQIAVIYFVHHATIHQIVNGKTWQVEQS